MAHGVVPAAKLSVLGVLNPPANGYATHNEGNEEERTSLLQASLYNGAISAHHILATFLTSHLLTT